MGRSTKRKVTTANSQQQQLQQVGQQSHQHQHKQYQHQQQQHHQQQQQQQQQLSRSQRHEASPHRSPRRRNRDHPMGPGTSWLSWRGAASSLLVLGSALVAILVWRHLQESQSTVSNDKVIPGRKSGGGTGHPPEVEAEEESDDIVPGHQRASLLRPFSVDLRALLAERETNMARYAYNYSRWGVDRRSELSLKEYRDVYDGKWPVLITDVVPQWSAFNWSRDFLFENYGQERVTMKAVDNSLDQAVSLALPLELFYKNTHKAFPNRWTYVEDELFIPTRPQLRKDIGPCEYLQEDYYKLFPADVRPWNAMLLWGTRYSRSSLHIDPYNWTGTNAVLKGLKRWKLFPPGQDHLLHVIGDRRSGFPLDCYKYNSPVDGFDPDLSLYPSFLEANYLEVDQREGELLLIPTGWFHQAFNAEETIAVSSQVMNRNNFRIVLEEILKAGTLKRHQLPKDIDLMSPPEQVRAIMSLLPKHVLDRGREVTADALYQIKHGYKDTNYQMPIED